MTTSHRSMNRITIIAVLGTQRELLFSGRERRVNEVEVRRERIRSGAMMDSLMLQMESPWGLPYALPLRVNQSIIGGELLVQRTSETRRRIKIEGRLAMVRSEDRRFTTDPLAEGRITRDLQVMVERVSLPTDDEQEVYGAHVEMDAQIVMPCRYPRNHEIGLRMMTTVVQVSGMRRNSLVQGAYHQASDTFNRVLVAVPEQHPNAAYMLRRGNQVHLTGDLEFVFETIGGSLVQSRIQQIDALWEPQIQAATERNAPPQEMRRLWNRYRNERLRIAEQMRLRVAVLDLEPAPDAIPGSIEANQEWYREVRMLRRAARQAQAQRSQNATLRNGAGPGSPPAMVEHTDIPTAEPVPEAAQPSSDMNPSKPRRQSPQLGQERSEIGTMNPEGANDDIEERTTDAPIEEMAASPDTVSDDNAASIAEA